MANLSSLVKYLRVRLFLRLVVLLYLTLTYIGLGFKVLPATNTVASLFLPFVSDLTQVVDVNQK
jgi:hypothetical protein